jgi:hypothetical protein
MVSDLRKRRYAMNCDRHLLNLRWEQHDWVRLVSATEDRSVPAYDMWGRPILNEHVTCHVRYACRRCGATRDGEDCTCDKDRADRCARRLRFLDSQREALDARRAARV